MIVSLNDLKPARKARGGGQPMSHVWIVEKSIRQSKHY
jgi:hypothetical protein